MRFIPTAYIGSNGGNGSEAFKEYRAQATVTGVVSMIHEGHRWYRVDYSAAGTIQHECFKF